MRQYYSGELGKFKYDDDEFILLTDIQGKEYLHYIGGETHGENIKIPDNCVNCRRMFENNFHLVSPPEYPKDEFGYDIVISTWGTFRNCYNLKSSGRIPDTDKDCTCMYYGCGLIKTPPLIVSGVLYCNWMFAHCVSLKSKAKYESPCVVKEKDAMYYRCDQFNDR